MMRRAGSLDLPLASPRRPTTAWAVLAVLAAAGAGIAARPAARTTATPDAAPALAGVLQRPVSLDVAPDGRVYLSDPGPGLVQVMWPWGEFAAPIGATGPEEARLEEPAQLAVGRDPSSGHDRLYVVDAGAKRVVVYDLDGGFVAEWPKIKGSGIAVAPDGRVFVADRTDYTIRVFTPEGIELFRFGEKGEERGQFANFTDIGISPDGRALAVGDRKGKRVQIFDLPADPSSDDVRVRRAYDLEQGRYTSGDLTCRATVVNALGGEEAWIGEGNGACRLTADPPTFPIASSTLEGLICKPTVRLPRIRRGTGQFYALGVYDPNLGACGNKQTALPAAPVVLRYLDIDLKRVHTLWPVPGSAYVARASDDAMVRDTEPDKSFGNGSEIQVRKAADQVMRGYWRFEVEGSAAVVGHRRAARLHLFANNGSDDAGDLYAVANQYPTTTPDTTPTPWTEDNVTWNSAPPLIGTPVARGGAVADNAWAVFDVSTAVPGDGTYSFALANASADRVDYNSREADLAPPLLIFDMRIAAAPTPANVVRPSATPTPLPTDVATPTDGPPPPPSDTPTPSATPTASPTRTPLPTFTPSPTFEPGSGLVFAPLHDTRVQSSSPNKGYGDSAQLRVRTGVTTTIHTSYLKFEVSGIPDPAAILTATLRLYAYDGGPDLTVRRVADTLADGSAPWTEATLTWGNAPPIAGAPLAVAAPVMDEAYVELGVTAVITGNGPVSFGLTTSSENSLYFHSKEAPDRRPELVVRVRPDPSNPVTPPTVVPPTATATPVTPTDTPAPVTPTDTPGAGTPATATRTPSPTRAATSTPPVDQAYLPWTYRTGPRPTPSATRTTAPTLTPSITPTFTPSPTFAPGSALVFEPAHDARVQSTAPDRSFGDAPQLRLRAGITTTVYTSYLKFEVDGLDDPRRVLTATLRLYAYDGGTGVAVRRVADTFADGSGPWTELEVTWNNAPPLSGPPLATAAPVRTDAYLELDVSAAVTGNGPVSFGLATDSENSIYFHSKEAPVRHPELVLRLRPAAPNPFALHGILPPRAFRPHADRRGGP